MDEKKIVDQEEFVFEGTEYIARLYCPAGKSSLYGEIVIKESGERPYMKMKRIAREYLRPYGIDVPTDAKTMVTHNAVQKLIEVIRVHKN